MSSISVTDIVNNYKKRKNKNIDPSPKLLFIITAGVEISTIVQSERRLNLKERRQLFSDAWDNLEFNEKAKYTEASIQLGYTSRINFDRKRAVSDTLASRLKILHTMRERK